jgi:hypothetical protein
MNQISSFLYWNNAQGEMDDILLSPCFSNLPRSPTRLDLEGLAQRPLCKYANGEV